MAAIPPTTNSNFFSSPPSSTDLSQDSPQPAISPTLLPVSTSPNHPHHTHHTPHTPHRTSPRARFSPPSNLIHTVFSSPRLHKKKSTLPTTPPHPDTLNRIDALLLSLREGIAEVILTRSQTNELEV
jgi:hypothetical protein